MEITTDKKENSVITNAPGRTLAKRADRISAERNIEKWPAIWQTAKAHTNPEARHFEREIELADGRRVKSKVKVGFTDDGVLTTEDQRTYYALIKQWQDNGHADEQVAFSIRKLARLLQRKGWGSNVIDSITHSLRKLRVTPFTWTNSYHDAVTGQELEEELFFNILSELKIVRRKTDGHITYEGGYYRFNDFLVHNLLARHTKPVLLDTILKFESEVAQLLYTHIDLMLFDKRQYERRTKELFDELGIRGVAYKNASNRKQKLVRALQELNGVRLTSGWVSEARIERTADKKDYKVIFRKTGALGRSHRNKVEEGSVAEVPTPPKNVPVKTESESPATAASDLVCHFQKIFHGIENHIPRSKELNQAISLVATSGFVRARYIVDFSRRAAEETNYKPQTFGGILQYTSRALAHHEKNRREEEVRRNRRLAEDQATTTAGHEEEERKRLIESLDPAEYQTQFERAKAEILNESPWLAAHRGSTLFKGIIETRIVDYLKEGQSEEPKSSEKTTEEEELVEPVFSDPL